MNKEEQILSAILQDKYRQCENRGIPTHTGFLAPAEVSFAEAFCIKEKACFVLTGGTEDAERRICVFFPAGYDPAWLSEGAPGRARTSEELAAEVFLCVLKLSVPRGSKPLSHRDYLGSLLGLGVERSVAGDIFVRENGADIIVLREMADYLAQNLSSVGRSEVSVFTAGLDALDLGEQKTEEFRDTVASLRLDSVAASAFRSARGRAQEAIRQGLVFVNGRQVLKPDFELSEGDRISVRGKGKAVLSEVGGRTRKDRLSIFITRFL